MKVKLLHICVLHFWALSLIAAPMALLFMPDDNVVLTLNNACEEETGETDLPGPIQEKLIVLIQVPDFCQVTADRSEVPAAHPFVVRDFICDVVLPPPEGRHL